MVYYGLQPLLKNDNLPNILKSDLGLFLMDSNAPLPCVINSIDINNEYTIPIHPIDTNQFIGDTIITKPTTVSLELFIYEEDENAFHSLIQVGVHKGFYFVNRTKTIYKNLYLTNKGITFNNDMYGGFTCSLELQEVIKVTALESTATLPSQKKQVDRGDVAPKKVPDEVRKDKIKQSCLKMFKEEGFGSAQKCIERLLGI